MLQFFDNLHNYVFHHSPLLLWILVLLLGVLLVIVVYTTFRLTLITKLLKQNNLQQSELIRGQSDACVYWWQGDKTAVCSAYLKEQLGGGTAPRVSLKKLESFFENFSLSSFVKTVHTQRKFKCEAKTSKGDAFSLMGGARRLDGRRFYVLWVRNISHQAAKVKLLNDVILELRTEHDMMLQVLNELPIPTWYKSHKGELLFCNSEYADALETTVDQALTEQLILKSWQQGGRLPNLTDLVICTQQTQTQKSHIVLKSDRQLVEFTETPVGKHGVVGYMMNRNSEEKLQSEIEHLNKSTKEVLEVISLPVIIYNNQQQVEFFNGPFLNMFELDPEWLSSKPTFSEVLEELRARRKVPDTEDFQSYKSRRLACFNNLLEPIEDIAYYPDGKTVRVVTAPYHDGGLMLTFNDITDHLTLERRYNTLLAVHRQVADNLFEGLAVFGSDHRLKLFNSAFCKMWHYEEGELDDSPHLDAVIGKIKQYIDYNHYDASWENFKTRIRAKIIDRSQKKDGRIKLYDDVVYDYLYTPLPDGSNLLTFLDISDRYRIEKSLIERSEALELAHSLKSDFISTVYQGVKYPLRRVLVNFSDMFEGRYGKINDKYLDRLRGLWQEVDEILRFVEDANDLASIESGNTNLKKGEIDLLSLLKGVIQTLEERAQEKTVKVIVSIEESSDFKVLGDLKRLKQMFFNLLRNAILFSRRNETIKVAFFKREGSTCVELSTEKNLIPYEDTYGTSKKLKRGQQVITGLGFSLIKKIMKLHEAQVELEQDKGTLVRCIFNSSGRKLIKN